MKRTVFLVFDKPEGRGTVSVQAAPVRGIHELEVLILVPEAVEDFTLPSWASRSVQVPFKGGMPMLSGAELDLAGGAQIAFADLPFLQQGAIPQTTANILITDWWTGNDDFLPLRRERNRNMRNDDGRYAIESEEQWLAHLQDGGDPDWLLFDKPVCWVNKSWLLDNAAPDARMAPCAWLQGRIQQSLRQGQSLTLHYLDAAPVSLPDLLAMTEQQRMRSLQHELQAWAALLSCMPPAVQSRQLLQALALHRPWLLTDRVAEGHPVAQLAAAFKRLHPAAAALRDVLKEGAAWLVVKEEQIDAIQVQGRQSAADWSSEHANLQIAAVRSEAVRFDRFLIVDCFDLSFYDQDGQFFQLMALYRQHDGRWVLPSLLASWPDKNIDALVDKIRTTAALVPRNGTWTAPALGEQLESLGSGRFLPGFEAYATLVQHTARYRWAASHGSLGKVLDCASGAGYGWHILDDAGTMSDYTGIDLDYQAIAFSRRFLRGMSKEGSILKQVLGKIFGPAAKPCRFEARMLDTLPKAAYDTVISFETIEHTDDPEVFLWDLSERIAPGGRLLLSLPAERWAGTHLNSNHWTNWTEARVRHLCERVFAKIRLLRLRLSLIAPETFQSALYHEAGAEAGEDEGFLLVLQDPRPRQLAPRVVLQRRFAMGDALLATSLVASLRQKYPDHQMVVKTAVVEAFQGLEDIDIVGCMELAVRPDDVFIDLDGSYEAQRGLHIVEAYARTAGVQSGPVKMALIHQDYRSVAAKILAARWLEAAPPAHIAAIHMQASSPFRIWPLAHWISLIETLIERGVGVILVGGGSDGGLEHLPEVLRPKILSMVRESRLAETAACIAVADLLIAPDSGLTHVASAVGTPVIGLYGMVEPALRLPLTGRSIGLIADIECKGCLAQLPADALPLCHRGHAYCMDELKPTTVNQACQTMLQDLPASRWRQRLFRAWHPNRIS